MRLAFSLCLIALALVAPPRTAHAQAAPVTQTASNATELDSDDPRAKRALGFVTILLSKNTAEAQKYLKTHAVPGSLAAADIDTTVKDLQSALAAGLEVARVVGGNDDFVMVGLSSTAAERGARMGVRFQIERDAPYRIREVASVMPRQIGGGD